MSAINGKQYVERINQLKANVWVDGKLVTGDIEKKKDLLFLFQVIQKELNLFVENHLQEKIRRLIIH
jgi:hypothetical protein